MFDFTKLIEGKSPNNKGQYNIPYNDLNELIISEIQLLTKTTLGFGNKYNVGLQLIKTLKEIKGLQDDQYLKLPAINELLTNLNTDELNTLSNVLKVKLVESRILPASNAQAVPAPYPNPHSNQPQILPSQKEGQPTSKHADKCLSHKTPGPVRHSHEKAERRKVRFAEQPEPQRTFNDCKRFEAAENQRRASVKSGKGFSLTPQ